MGVAYTNCLWLELCQEDHFQEVFFLHQQHRLVAFQPYMYVLAPATIYQTFISTVKIIVNYFFLCYCTRMHIGSDMCD
jgi:hypothetical protein